MMAAQHGTYAANVLGSTGDSGDWIREYKLRLTDVKKPWDGKCCFQNCPKHEHIVGGHVWIQGQISNEYYYIVPICRNCNDFRNQERAYDNWTKLKTGTKVLRINVKKDVSKLWNKQMEGFVRRRFNDKEAEPLVETDIATDGIIDADIQRELDIAMGMSLHLSQSELEDFVDNY